MATNNITNAGMTALIAAAATGFQLQLDINAFKLGSSNAPFDPTVTDVPGTIVFTGGSPNLTAMQTPDPNVILYCVTLDPSIGTFTFGSIGLYLSTGQLFTYISLANPLLKTATNLPGVFGDTRTYYFPVEVSQSDNAFDITVSPLNTTDLPTVPSFSSLPAPGQAVFNCYIVTSDSTLGGEPSMVFTDGTTWFHISGVAGVATSKFATTIIADGTSTVYTITHNLGSTDIISQLYSVNPTTGVFGGFDTPAAKFGGTTLGYIPLGEIFPATVDTASLTFQSPPAAGTQYRVVIIG
jgi:Phage tail-collar fibre protein